jgi:uncharacterized membrane protein HdeD (DUF308 family)
MSETTYNPFVGTMQQIRGSWGWFMVLGILLSILGAVCVVFDVSATFATVLVFGWLLMIGGVFSLVHAFQTRSWSGSLLFLLSALFRGFVGYLLIRYPISGAISLTLVLASLFVVGGLFRAIGAAMTQFPRWGWSFAAGIISLALGVMLLWQMPVSSIWFMGFAIGIDLFVDGIAIISFAAAAHALPEQAAQQATA